MEDPSELEVVAVPSRKTQQHLSWCPLESVVVVAIHPDKPRITGNPNDVEAIAAVIVAVNALAQTTITGDPVVVVVPSDIMKSHYNRGIVPTMNAWTWIRDIMRT